MQFTVMSLAICVLTSMGLTGPVSNYFSPQRGRAKPVELLAVHERVLRMWLKTHPDLRPAQMGDCEDVTIDSSGKEHKESCQRLLNDLRATSKNPNASPFYVKGDFNGDGSEDFAVVLTKTSSAKSGARPATVAVFNGPFPKGAPVDPAFLLTRKSVSETFLFYGFPRKKPWRLVISLPESEGHAVLWQNGKYVLR
jgi:hypothetical protein